jgi:hypothetical protein
LAEWTNLNEIFTARHRRDAVQSSTVTAISVRFHAAGI